MPSLGMIVDVARSGSTVIKRLEQNCEYDLIITSMHFDSGSFDGIDLLRKIKSSDKYQIPIVLLATNVDSLEMPPTLEFDGILEKPLNVEKLKEVLEKIFER